MTTRRDFLKSSAFTIAASAAGIAGAPQFAFGQSLGGKTLIKVFMRGGADGLHLFPPVADSLYYQYRPDLAIEAPSDTDASSALDLGLGYRALNPNLIALQEIWEEGRMMVAPSTALPEGNRSHFDNQRWIGTGAHDNFIDGYLNRYMQTVTGVDHSLRGAILGKTSVSREISGAIPIPALESSDNFDLNSNFFCTDGTGACADHQLTEYLRQISSNSVSGTSIESYVRETQIAAIETIDGVAAATASYVPTGPAATIGYSNNDIGRGLKVAAELIKGDIPLEVAVMDWNVGWDSHSDQIISGDNPFYNEQMAAGAQDFLTFYRDMGDLMDDIIVLVATEFGRTVHQNGSRGTDHGQGGAWFAFGGPTRRVMADDITSLEDSQLLQGRYLPTITNYRDLVGEIMVRHMGITESLVEIVFPGHNFTDLGLFTGS